MPETKVDIPESLWRVAISNWQVRCLKEDVRPPFEWALEFHFGAERPWRVELDRHFKYTHRFTIPPDTLHALLTNRMHWSAYLETQEFSGEDEADTSELYEALRHFHV